MTTKEQIKYKIDLTALAKDKGFESSFLHGKPYLHSNKEPLRWLFWLTEVNQWLSEKRLGVFIIPFNQHGYFMQYYPSSISFEPQVILKFDTYEDALADRIKNSLSILPNV